MRSLRAHPPKALRPNRIQSPHPSQNPYLSPRRDRTYIPTTPGRWCPSPGLLHDRRTNRSHDRMSFHAIGATTCRVVSPTRSRTIGACTICHSMRLTHFRMTACPRCHGRRFGRVNLSLPCRSRTSRGARRPRILSCAATRHALHALRGSTHIPMTRRGHVTAIRLTT